MNLKNFFPVDISNNPLTYVKDGIEYRVFVGCVVLGVDPNDYIEGSSTIEPAKIQILQRASQLGLAYRPKEAHFYPMELGTIHRESRTDVDDDLDEFRARINSHIEEFLEQEKERLKLA